MGYMLLCQCNLATIKTIYIKYGTDTPVGLKIFFFTVAHVSEIIITDLTISLVLTRDNVLRIIFGPYVPYHFWGLPPKEFDSVHQTRFSPGGARERGVR